MAEFTEEFVINDYEVLSDTGWQDIKGIGKTIPYRRHTIYTKSFALDCADTHIVFDKDFNEVFVKDLKLGQEIWTEKGLETIEALDNRDYNSEEQMYDLVLDDTSNHRYYTDGILSHNSTIYCVFSTYYCLFNKDRKILLVANKESTVKELLQRIKMAVSMLPSFLQLGVTSWSAKKIEFENGSSITVSATSPDSARGSSCDVCLSDSSWVFIKENGQVKYVPLVSLQSKSSVINTTTEDKASFADLLKTALEDKESTEDLKVLLEHSTRCKNSQLDFHIDSGCLTVPTCPVCGKKLYDRFRNKEYYHTCSVKCSKIFKHYLDSLPNIQTFKPVQILTKDGFEDFEAISINDSDETYEIRFDNSDVVIKCSPEHKFFVNGKETKAKELAISDTVDGLSEKRTISSITKTPNKDHLYDVVNSGKSNTFFVSGILTHNCILDEAAFIPNNIMDEFVASVFPTISSKPEGKIIAVSTPNGIGNWFERTYNNAFYQLGDDNGLKWNQVTFPWWEHPERDENWKKKQLAMLNFDERKFNQEFACCFLGSSATLIDTKALEYYRKDILNYSKAYTTTKILDFNIKVWSEVKPEHAYVLGVDIADGSGNDSSVIQIFDVTDSTNIEEVAAFNSKEIDTNSLALIVAKLGARYNTALVAGERNGVGAGFFDILTNVFEYDNIVNFKNKDEPADRPGIYSTNTNKVDACLWAKTLTTLTVNEPTTVKVTIKEASTGYELEYFESHSTARSVSYSASKNNHDDFVMSFIWAMFALKLDIAENYFNVRQTVFSSTGVEIPKHIIPVIIPEYTEEYIDNKILKKDQSLETLQDSKADAANRAMIQDGIFRAMFSNESVDDW